MIVYRICDEREKELLLNNGEFIIGNNWNINASSTHNYNSEVKYIHFFNEIESVLLFNSVKGYYICEYDIDDDIVNKYTGVGNYYDDNGDMVSAMECAIPNSELSFSNLESIREIKDTLYYIDLMNLDRKTNCVYKREKSKSL